MLDWTEQGLAGPETAARHHHFPGSPTVASGGECVDQMNRDVSFLWATRTVFKNVQLVGGFTKA